MVLLACPAFCSYWRLLFSAQSIELAQFFFLSWTRGGWDETSGLAVVLNVVFTRCVNCGESFIHSLHYLLSSTSKVSDTNPCACCCWQMSTLQDPMELQMNCWHLLLTVWARLGIKGASGMLSVCRMPIGGARLQIPIQFSGLYQGS